MKIKVFRILGLAVVAAGAGCGGGGDGGDGKVRALKVGMDLTYPPFEMIDEGGMPSGVSVEMAKELGRHLGREVEIESLPFESLIPSLKTGKIDLIISSMTANDARRESIDFSDPYATTGLALLVPAGSEVGSVGDLDAAGKRVVVRLGTTGEAYAREHLKRAEVSVLDQDPACVMEVVQSRADAFIYDQLSVYHHHRRQPKTTRAILAPFQREQWAVGIDKRNGELKEQVNAFLKEFRETGGFERLGETYLSEEKKMLEAAGVPFILSDWDGGEE